MGNPKPQKNPFEARPTKVPRAEEAPITSTNTTSVPDSIATINDRLSCDSANMKQLPPSSAETREKQSSASEKPATVCEKPSQRRDPKCFLDRGKNSRPFRPSWFDHDEWKTWLHYDQEKDAAFCFACIKAVEQNLISSKNVEKAFISAGYKNWSDAATSRRGFDKHNRSDAHTEAHQRLYIIPQQCEDIGEQISQTHAEEKSVSQQALLKILSNIRFLARQVLPLREDGDGTDSNFTQLHILREEDNSIWKQWRTEKKTDK